MSTIQSRKLEVLPPSNSQLSFSDQQPKMAFGMQSVDRQTLKNNTVGLANAAHIFGEPTTIAAVENRKLFEASLLGGLRLLTQFLA